MSYKPRQGGGFQGTANDTPGERRGGGPDTGKRGAGARAHRARSERRRRGSRQKVVLRARGGVRGRWRSGVKRGSLATHEEGRPLLHLISISPAIVAMKSVAGGMSGSRTCAVVRGSGDIRRRQPHANGSQRYRALIGSTERKSLAPGGRGTKLAGGACGRRRGA